MIEELPPDKPYRIPDPAIEPGTSLILYYKVLKGVPFDNRNWDLRNFGKLARTAKEILDACRSFKEAKKLLEYQAERMDSQGLPWSLGTVAEAAYGWMKRKGASNVQQDENIKRFFDAIARQRAENDSPKQGTNVEDGTIPDPMRSLRLFQDRTDPENTRTNITDGGSFDTA